MAAIDADFSEVLEVAADLGKAASRLLKDADAVAKKGAQNVKSEMIEDARGTTHFRQIERAISYERDYGAGEIGYEIGPVRGGPGSLAGAYFGWPHGGGSLSLEKPLRSEEPRLLKAVDDLAMKALGL
ncbi:hypothetical protein ABRQ22_17255 [Cellulosimicrobium sp. ES-005]|uniref:HK97 gp10 family phage protein n=1 Tax=Cellulosimicrobium sp. ES-005 TaxID=3163031 RepID=A0AAU8FZR2_9MICO